MTSIRRWKLFELPAPLQGFLVLQALVASATGIAVLVHSGAAPRSSWILLGLLAAAGLISDRVTARMGLAMAMPGSRETGNVSVSTLSVWVFVAVVAAPPQHAMALAVLLTVSEDVRKLLIRRHTNPFPIYRLVFNAGMAVMATVAGSLTYAAVESGYQTLGTTGAQLLAGVVASAAIYLVSSLSLAMVMMLARGAPYRFPLGLLATSSLEELGLMSLGFLLALAWRADPLLIVVGLPTVALLQQALLHKQLREAAARDAKTGVASLAAWRDTAEGVLDRVRTAEGNLGVLLVDLDHFKAVNDTHGHLVGDEVLMAVADAMRGAVRDRDLVGRFGGEEFIVLLPDAGPTVAGQVAERIRLAIAAVEVPVEGRAEPLRVTTSVGVGLYPDDGMILNDLLSQADRALYSAKHSGRDQVAFVRDLPARPALPTDPGAREEPPVLDQDPQPEQQKLRLAH